MIYRGAILFFLGLFMCFVSNLPAYPLIVAHRGVSGHYPENTLIAFEKAVELSQRGCAAMIELDVHLTLDNEVVVIHDDTVDETTNGHGRVRELTLAQIKQLDASGDKQEFSPVSVPTLNEVLALVKNKILLNIEIKARGIANQARELLCQKVVDLVRAHDMKDEVVISSFDHELLGIVGVLDPSLKRFLLIGYDTFSRYGITDANLIAYIKKQGAIGASFLQMMVSEQLIQEMHEAGLRIGAWTVNDLIRGKELLDWGIDLLFTDYPEEMSGVI